MFDHLAHAFLHKAPGFAIGAVTTALAALLSWLGKAGYRKWITFRKLWIVGSWGEYPEDTDGNYGIGEISYDYVKMQFNYHGTCYTKEVHRYSEWCTINSNYSNEDKRLYYIFRGRVFGQGGSDHTGFGVIFLSSFDKKLVPSAGYFIAPNVDKAARNHSMVRLPFKYSASVNGRLLVDTIKSLQLP